MTRHLVTRADVQPHLDAAAGVLEHAARGDLLLGDGDVVPRVEDDGDVCDGVGCHEAPPVALRDAAESTGHVPPLQQPRFSSIEPRSAARCPLTSEVAAVIVCCKRHGEPSQDPVHEKRRSLSLFSENVIPGGISHDAQGRGQGPGQRAFLRAPTWTWSASTTWQP